MLDWTAGPLRAADALSAPINEGVSYIDEPPETPAHIFALRAFKTALFGTPRPETTISRKVLPSTLEQRPIDRTDTASKNVGVDLERVERNEDVGQSSVPPLPPTGSPTKGILLTPGAGTSRRKNVSFMHMEFEAENLGHKVLEEDELQHQDDSPTRRTHQRDRRPRPTTLTQTLIDLSKHKTTGTLQETSRIARTPLQVVSPKHNPIDEGIQTEFDHTLDLSKPRSKSGQHWKFEYDQYLQRSNQEIRSVIQHGQHVKSFAVKRDSEAAELEEQLRKEQEKFKILERRLARTTERLKISQATDPKGTSTHARLIGELAQQTALAERYEQQLEGLQNAAFGDEVVHGSKKDENNDELLTLQETAREAVERATNIEAQNAHLKRQLARVKQEMMSYEPRRLAREEKLRQRGEKHKSAREAAETRLLNLKIEAPDAGSEEKVLTEAVRSGAPTAPHDVRHAETQEQRRPIASQKQGTRSTLSNDQPNPRAASPRKRRTQNPTVDIWTFNSSPKQQEEQQPPPPGQPVVVDSSIPPSSVKQDVDRALLEIDLNLRSDHGNASRQHKPWRKEPIGFEDGQPVWPETSPTALDISLRPAEAVSSPAKLPVPSPAFNRSDLGTRSRATVGRSASMLSRSHGAGRTTSMASARSMTSNMTAERAAAAKNRLARRSAEKKRVAMRT